MSMTKEELEKAKFEGRKVQWTDWLDRLQIGSVVTVECTWPRYHGKQCAEVHDGRIFEPGGFDDVPWEDLELAPPEISRYDVRFSLDVNLDEYRLAHPDMPRRPLMGSDFETAVRNTVYELLAQLVGNDYDYKGNVMSVADVNVRLGRRPETQLGGTRT